ncbi:MAG: molybdopterin-dependent oxidoreductase [Desulfobacterales bacterium]|nr:molybdopterin-dependent oxidoreductase [Desulfobacterales bacterium]
MGPIKYSPNMFSETKEEKNASRRAFMARAGGAVVRIGLPGVFVKLLDAKNRALASERREDGKPRIPPGQHVVKKIVGMGRGEAEAPLSDWKLRIHGEVRNPITLDYAELIQLGQENFTCDIHCVTGWTLLDSRWTGLCLTKIMDLVQPREKARFVIFESSGGYTSNIPMVEARKGNVLLAHGLSGVRLPRAHGAPVRALVPDRYLHKGAKWLKGIKFTSRDEPGYWEALGYSNSADPWKEERFQSDAALSSPGPQPS